MIAGLDRIHEGACLIADEMAERASAIGASVTRLGNGARLIDAGVGAPGSDEAGRLFALACMGGLGRLALGGRRLGGAAVREARVTVSHPLVACMAAQYAGWAIKAGRFHAMGSGPARAQAAAEPLFGRYRLAARAERTVLLLETSALPGPEVAEIVAAKCGLPPGALTLVAAATGSAAGTMQVAARSVETALHKLMELDFDLTTIVAGSGTCPVAPPTGDALLAIGRTNDAVLYGAEVTLWTRADDRAIEAVLERVPARASRDYGRPFHELFREYGDFYRIDPLLFSPGRITFINAPGGRTHSAGVTDEAMLARSFGLAGGA